jgi:phage terminase large subunit-like protein
MAGRGFGKTKAGAEWVRFLAENHLASRIALVGPTAADVRQVMVEGVSGIVPVSRPDLRPRYLPSLGGS